MDNLNCISHLVSVTFLVALLAVILVVILEGAWSDKGIQCLALQHNGTYGWMQKYQKLKKSFNVPYYQALCWSQMV